MASATAVVVALLVGSSMASATAPAISVAPRTTTPRRSGYPPTDLTTKVTRRIVFPVIGTVHWTDTFGACRAGCSRLHEGQDLMGTKLQKLVACADAKVVATVHESAGNYLYLEDGAGWYYGFCTSTTTTRAPARRNPMAWAFAQG